MDNRMKPIYCAKCDKEIKGYYYTVGDNFLQVKYFDCPDGSDNVFCSQDCLCEALSVITVEIEEVSHAG